MSSVQELSSVAKLPALAAAFKPAIPIRARYENWIGGQPVAPVRGGYFTNPSPVSYRMGRGIKAGRVWVKPSRQLFAEQARMLLACGSLATAGRSSTATAEGKSSTDSSTSRLTTN